MFAGATIYSSASPALAQAGAANPNSEEDPGFEVYPVRLPNLEGVTLTIDRAALQYVTTQWSETICPPNGERCYEEPVEQIPVLSVWLKVTLEARSENGTKTSETFDRRFQYRTTKFFPADVMRIRNSQALPERNRAFANELFKIDIQTIADGLPALAISAVPRAPRH